MNEATYKGAVVITFFLTIIMLAFVSWIGYLGTRQALEMSALRADVRVIKNRPGVLKADRVQIVTSGPLTVNRSTTNTVLPKTAGK